MRGHDAPRCARTQPRAAAVPVVEFLWVGVGRLRGGGSPCCGVQDRGPCFAHCKYVRYGFMMELTVVPGTVLAGIGGVEGLGAVAADLVPGYEVEGAVGGGRCVTEVVPEEGLGGGESSVCGEHGGGHGFGACGGEYALERGEIAGWWRRRRRRGGYTGWRGGRLSWWFDTERREIRVWTRGIAWTAVNRIGGM